MKTSAKFTIKCTTEELNHLVEAVNNYHEYMEIKASETKSPEVTRDYEIVREMDICFKQLKTKGIQRGKELENF